MSCVTALEEISLASGETLNATMSFVNALADGETLVSGSVTASPTGLTLGSVSVVSGIAYFTISSTTVGRYLVKCTVVSSTSETLIGQGNLRVLA